MLSRFGGVGKTFLRETGYVKRGSHPRIKTNRTCALQIVVARFLIPIHRGFIGRRKRYRTAMNRRTTPLIRGAINSQTSPPDKGRDKLPNFPPDKGG